MTAITQTQGGQSAVVSNDATLGSTASTDGASQTASSSIIDGQLMAELSSLLQELGVSVQGKHAGSSGTSGAGNGTAAQGSPALAPPKSNLSPDDIALGVQSITDTMNDLQMQAEGNSVKAYNTIQETCHKRNVENIEKAAEARAKAAKKAKILKVFGILGKVFAAIASVAMTALTGGAAAPLAAALMAYTIVDTAMTVAGAISQASGGPSLALDDLMTQGFTKMLEDCGVSPDQAKSDAGYMTMGFQALMAVATIGTGVAGALSKGEKLIEMGALATQAAKITQVTAQVMNGVNMAASGGLSISAAGDQRAELQVQADTQRVSASLAMCKQLIDSTADTMTALVQMSAQTAKQIAGIVDTAHQADMAQLEPSTV